MELIRETPVRGFGSKAHWRILLKSLNAGTVLSVLRGISNGDPRERMRTKQIT